MFTSLLAVFLITSLGMVLLWFYQRWRGEADIVDAGWAGSLALAAIVAAVLGAGDPLRRTILAIGAGFWGARLCIFLLLKRVRVPGEDTRYRELRKLWGERAQLKFFWFFQAQALMVALLAVSYFVVAGNSTPAPTIYDFIAVAVFIISLVGESIADHQLARFRSNPANHGFTCKVGLWRYSRHPNYFFEWLHWWAYVLLAIGSLSWQFTLIAPLLMLIFLLKVTGIPPIEKRAANRPDWAEYKASTSAFFPWFPKSKARGVNA